MQWKAAAGAQRESVMESVFGLVKLWENHKKKITHMLKHFTSRSLSALSSLLVFSPICGASLMSRRHPSSRTIPERNGPNVLRFLLRQFYQKSFGSRVERNWGWQESQTKRDICRLSPKAAVRFLRWSLYLLCWQHLSSQRFLWSTMTPWLHHSWTKLWIHG